MGLINPEGMIIVSKNPKTKIVDNTRGPVINFKLGVFNNNNNNIVLILMSRTYAVIITRIYLPKMMTYYIAGECISRVRG